MKPSYHIYEDNGGGVHMIVTADGSRHVFTHLEYDPEPGIVIDMIRQLKDDPSAWETWDGWEGEVPEEDLADEIEENDALIAWGEGGTIETEDFDDIGFAGRHALALSEPEEE